MSGASEPGAMRPAAAACYHVRPGHAAGAAAFTDVCRRQGVRCASPEPGGRAGFSLLNDPC